MGPTVMQKQTGGMAVSLSLGFFYVFSCATTKLQRTCCDLKGIPLADKTLKTAKHLGPGSF
uniref:Alternative protein HIPK2 n=1 Tax=Homo sapiens TaxID=9606 RepID=L8ECJ8_HUMAN|nr:alternative protein HIPK2 [Homo sapiens]